MTVVSAPAQRFVPLDNVMNFRDMGGYAAGDGRCVAWGRLFRADALHKVSADDVVTMDALGIRTIIDLRTSNELDAHGTFPVDAYPVVFHHLSIMDFTWDEERRVPLEGEQAASFLTTAYLDMARDAAPKLAEALCLIAVPGAGPLVFHCAAGKDRTGMLGALLLAALGVGDDDIVDDYALSREGMARLIEWSVAQRPEFAERLSHAPTAYQAAEPEAMRRTLSALRSEHGGVDGYLDSIGVGHAVREELRSAYLV